MHKLHQMELKPNLWVFYASWDCTGPVHSPPGWMDG